MATFDIKMPKLGESITEGTIVSWSVSVGDVIKEDSVLFEVSTAKVSAEIPSPVAGKILQILANAGDTVPVGNTVAVILLEGSEEEPGEPQPGGKEIRVEDAAPEQVPVLQTETQAGVSELQPAPVRAASVEKEESRWYSPVVLQLAGQAGITPAELDTVRGTGYLGRVSKTDIEAYIRNKAAGKEGVIKEPVIQGAPARDIPSGGVPSAAGVAANFVAPAVPANSEDRIIEMDRVRKLIADHMVLSKKVSPHVTSVVEVDVTRLVKWREKNKEVFQKKEGFSLTYMPAIAEAVTLALREFPMVNASVEGYQMILKKRINVGVAVSLPDGNLIVPVVKDADKLNLHGLASAIDTLAVKARNNKLAPDDIQGGTFTITNFGTFKTLIGMPIINQPQVAILGVGYIEKKPAVVETPEGDTIAIRHKMYLSLSYDHRIIDGALAGMFLHRVASRLENWHL